MNRAIVLVLGLLLVGSSGLAAQDHDSDRLGTRIDWGTAEVLLVPSAKLGMQLSIWTTAQAHLARSRGLGAGFQPDSALAWINIADRVARPTAAPRDPHAVLLTPALHAVGGDSIRVMRRAKGDHWEKRVSILLDESGRESRPLDILVDPQEAEEFLHGILREASLSGYDADSVAAAEAAPEVNDSVDTPPEFLQPGVRMYPDHRLRGRVTVLFVVDATGHPDMATYRAIAADHLIFVEWARSTVAGSTFLPARLHGYPIRTLVEQNIDFIP